MNRIFFHLSFFFFLFSLAKATPVRHALRRTFVFVFCLFSFVIGLLSCQRTTAPLPPANQPPALIKAPLTVEEVTLHRGVVKVNH